MSEKDRGTEKVDLRIEKKWIEFYRDAYQKDAVKLADAGYRTLSEALADTRRGQKEKR